MENIDESTLVKIPESIMRIPASKDWALLMSKFLESAFIDKDKAIFFVVGEYHNGKFLAYDDMGAEPDALLEAYSQLLKTNNIGTMSLYVGQGNLKNNRYLN